MKIYARERKKIGTGIHQPRFRVIAVTSKKDDARLLSVEGTHFRKAELEAIAKDLGAEVVYLEEMPDEEKGSMKED